MKQKTEHNERLLQLFREPLPAEAVKPHPTKSYLSQINAIYVIERLNDVLGLGSWKIDHEIIENRPAQIRQILRKGQLQDEFLETMVVVRAKFHALIPEEFGGGEIELEAFGGNDNDDLGDAYKGACTDALTKIGSYLGIGAHVWKDKKQAPQGGQGGSQKPQGAQPAPSAKGDQGSDQELKWLNPKSEDWDGFVKAVAKRMQEEGGYISRWFDFMRDEHRRILSKDSRTAFEAAVSAEMKKGGAQ